MKNIVKKKNKHVKMTEDVLELLNSVTTDVIQLKVAGKNVLRGLKILMPLIIWYV